MTATAEPRDGSDLMANLPDGGWRHWRAQLSRQELFCGAAIAVGLVTSWVLFFLAPALLDHHGVLLEALSESTVSIITGGAFAHAGRDSLWLVIVAPFAAIAMYDVFWWWAGRLWGDRVASFYVKRYPRWGNWVLRFESLAKRRGFWALTISYYLPVPNFLVQVWAGAGGLPLAVFVAGDMIGLALWEGLLIGLGWAIGHPAVSVVDTINHYALLVTVGLIASVFVVAGARGRRHNGTSKQ